MAEKKGRVLKGTKKAVVKKRAVKKGAKRFVMNAKTRAKIVAAVAENRAQDLADVAREIRVPLATVRRYVASAEVKKEIAAFEAFAKEPNLEDIDRAMMKQARLGNVQAAKLVYMRMGVKGSGEVPTLEELEAELAALKAISE